MKCSPKFEEVMVTQDCMHWGGQRLVLTRRHAWFLTDHSLCLKRHRLPENTCVSCPKTRVQRRLIAASRCLRMWFRVRQERLVPLSG